MWSMILTHLVLLLFALCEANQLNITKNLSSLERKSYKNHALIRAYPKDFNELAFFKTFESFYNVTFWKKPTLVQNPVEFVISPDNLAELYRHTAKHPIDLTTVTKNIQCAFDKQIARPYINGTPESFNWNNYFRLNDIYHWLQDLSERYPDEVHLRNIGQSYEKRSILAVKLTLKGSIRRGKVIIEGGCHGNEWMSTAFVTYMLHTLLNAKKYDNDVLEAIALKYSWVFVPVMNPDGYEYSHTTDRLWRKNRRDGHGVDLNRNYGIAFGAYCPDKSKPESREYCGKGPFSEPETYAMSLFTKENSDNLEYYLSIHSFGQRIILPYSYTIEHKENYEQVKTKAEWVANHIHKQYGIEYTVGNNYDIEGYLSSGTSSDWVKRALKVPFVATLVLPDTGVHGYALPPDQILPICQATMDGLLLFFDPNNIVFRSGDIITQDTPDTLSALLSKGESPSSFSTTLVCPTFSSRTFLAAEFVVSQVVYGGSAGATMWGADQDHEAERETEMRRVSGSKKVPIFGEGCACSQYPDSLVLAARSLALSFGQQ